MVNREKIFGLDFMRCIAIVFVLIGHTVFLLPVSDGYKNLIFFNFGFWGVEIFFVLSGYLIGSILMNLFNKNSVGFNTARYFWIRRWFRTLPNYYLVLFLSAGVFYFSNKVNVFSDPENFLFLVFSQNLFTPHPGFFPLAWSLSVEEWFYLLLPLWFILWNKILDGKKSYTLSAIFSFILIFGILRIVAFYLNNPDWDSGIRRIVVFRLDAIMTGVLAAYVHLHFEKFWHRNKMLMLTLGLFLLFIITTVFYKNIGGIQSDSVFFFKTFFFNVVSLAISFTLPYFSEWKITSPSIFHKLIVHISRISYSLYLVHILVVFGVITLFNKISLAEHWGLKFIASWIFCILVSGFLYSKFELPLMNKRDRFRL